ncbi:MAG TPA: MarR family transcriptional regulator [Candidatus Saccharimonadales bacterium]|nr:MarR family transcriptional regulator [Candidatus Saccharimonadales bacterium]
MPNETGPHAFVAAIDRLMSLAQLWSNETAVFHEAAAERLGLNITDTKTLSILLQETKLSAGKLAERLGLTTGAVTSVIDRLEKRGFVRRIPHPIDRRKVLVQLQPANMQEAFKVYESIGRATRELYEGMSLEQLDFLAEYYQKATELAQEETAKLKSRKFSL